jgi:hypothetical protein
MFKAKWRDNCMMCMRMFNSRATNMARLIDMLSCEALNAPV